MIILLSCKKKTEPIVTNETPIFSFEGKINGIMTNIYSGTNDYFMYSDHGVDANNVKEFRGELKKRGCSSCTNGLKLIIKDYRLLNLAPTVIDSSLSSKYYSYSTPIGTPNSYSITFVPQFTGGTAQTYSWTFHDGNSSLASPSKIYSTLGKFNVCLNITSAASCSNGICHNVTIGSIGNNVEAGFAASTATGNAVNFTAQPALGTPPYSYLWNFGDANTSSLANPSHTYSTNGAYLVTLTVTDSKNNSSLYQNNVATQNPGTCITRFSHIKVPIANTSNLGNVIIEWTDANNTTFTTENNSQPIISGFKIISVEDYILNENQQRTKKIRAIFNCTLYNGSNSVVFEDAEIIFAFAYP